MLNEPATQWSRAGSLNILIICLPSVDPPTRSRFRFGSSPGLAQDPLRARVDMGPELGA